MFRQLQPTIGFGWAVRAIGFVALGLSVLPICVLRYHEKPSTSRRLMDVSAFKDWSFLVFELGTFLFFVGLYIPAFYVETITVSSIPGSWNSASLLVPLLNIGSFAGRVVRSPTLFFVHAS